MGVQVKCSLKELDAWTNICTKSDVIKQLKFSWEPRLDSLRCIYNVLIIHKVFHRQDYIFITGPHLYRHLKGD